MWQAAVTQAPVALAVARFGGLPGLVCGLDQGGSLTVSYQGTDPPTSAVVATDTKEVNYDEINKEHRELLQVALREPASPTKAWAPRQGKRRLETPHYL